MATAVAENGNERMKAAYKIDREQVEAMRLTISMTMSVKEWLAIIRTKSEAQHYEPFCKIQNMISVALGDITSATEKNYSVNEWLKKEVG